MKMYEMLEKILEDTTNWLSFAEAKNAALIAFNGVWGAICIDKFLECKSKDIAFIYAFLCILCIVSVIISLISFIPKMFTSDRFEEYLKSKLKQQSIDDNMLFYGDIFKYSPKEYFESFQKNILKLGENKIEKYESDKMMFEKQLALQIVTLSTIAYKKYYLFKIALHITISPLVLVVIGIVIA